MIQQVNMGQVIKRKLDIFRKMGCEIQMTAIRKTGDTQQLGITDMGENDKEERFVIKVLPVIIGSENGAISETANNMELGNNAEKYIEFVQAEQGKMILQTGDRVVYQEEEYIVYEILPVMLGSTLVCRQYKAKKVL